MWLLKLHFAISTLLLLTFYGFAKVCKKQIKENGWLTDKKKKKYSMFLFFFVPIMNFFIVAVLFMMIGYKKEDFETLTNKIKEESEK
jgi:hypothetical protein